MQGPRATLQLLFDPRSPRLSPFGAQCEGPGSELAAGLGTDGGVGALATRVEKKGRRPPRAKKPAKGDPARTFRALADCEKRLGWLRTAKAELGRARGDRDLATDHAKTAKATFASEADAKLAAAVALARDLRRAIAESEGQAAAHERGKLRVLGDLEALKRDLDAVVAETRETRDDRKARLDKVARRNAALERERQQEASALQNLRPAEDGLDGLPWAGP